MKFTTSTIINAILGATTMVSAAPASTSPNPQARSAQLGVNCRGSFYCGNAYASAGGLVAAAILDVVNYRVNAIGDNAAKNIRLAGGTQIACSVHDGYKDGTCAFFQGPNYNGNYNLWDARNALQQIVNHGCKTCGSQPLVANDVANAGQMTINYVSNACGAAVGHGNLNSMCF